MVLVELGVSPNANSFYRTGNGARHERSAHAPRASARRQQHLSRVIRAQVEPTNLSSLPKTLPETQETLDQQVGGASRLPISAQFFRESNL